jgi:hypothetical protein
MKTLVLLGAGGFARTLSDIVRQTKQFDKIVFLDDTPKEGISGSCSKYVEYIGEESEFYPAISDNQIRQSWIDILHEKELPIATIIHPSAYVSPMAILSDGVAILPGAIVNTGCRLESGVLVNCGAVIDHDCVVESCAHIKPKAVAKALSTVIARSIIE